MSGVKKLVRSWRAVGRSAAPKRRDIECIQRGRSGGAIFDYLKFFHNLATASQQPRHADPIQFENARPVA